MTRLKDCHMDEVKRLNLTIDVVEEGDNVIVRLDGELDVYTAPKLKRKLLPLTEKAGNKVEIELQKTSYLDSTGLGVFISAYKSANQHNSQLKFVHLQSRVLRLFKVTGLHEIMDIEVA